MLKVLTLLGTRPEVIKLSLVIAELDRQLDHVLVHAGQNSDFELSEVFFRDLGIRKPDHFLEVGNRSVAETIARVIQRFDEVLETERPDALLVLGDTNSSLGTIPAKRRKIPIFHMEAGNRCFDMRVPEEINRRIVDHISDINLVYTEHARRYLLAEGIRPDTVIKTGSPMHEVLSHFSSGIEASPVLANLGLERDGYFIVSAHREDTVDDKSRLATLLETLSLLADEFGKRVLFSVHPRTRARIDAFGLGNGAGVEFMKPLGFFDYVKLQVNSFCVVSDSGTITEEAAILGFRAVTVRDAHERPEGMDEGTLIMTGLNPARILEAVRVLRAQPAGVFRRPPDYDPGDVSFKVVRIILSYTDFVKRTVWREAPS